MSTYNFYFLDASQFITSQQTRDFEGDKQAIEYAKSTLGLVGYSGVAV